MLSVQNKPVKHDLNILRFLEAGQFLEKKKKMEVIHCRGHQKGNSEEKRETMKWIELPKSQP